MKVLLNNDQIRITIYIFRYKYDRSVNRYRVEAHIKSTNVVHMLRCDLFRNAYQVNNVYWVSYIAAKKAFYSKILEQLLLNET